MAWAGGATLGCDVPTMIPPPTAPLRREIATTLVSTLRPPAVAAAVAPVVATAVAPVATAVVVPVATAVVAPVVAADVVAAAVVLTAAAAVVVTAAARASASRVPKRACDGARSRRDASISAISSAVAPSSAHRRRSLTVHRFFAGSCEGGPERAPPATPPCLRVHEAPGPPWIR